MRLVVDRQGSDPERGSGTTTTGSSPQVSRSASCGRRSRARPAARSARAARRAGTSRCSADIDHRKLVVVDGRIGWTGGAGIEDHFQDGRFHDLFLRLTGPVVAQLQLVFVASFHWLGEARCGPRSSRRRSRSSTAAPVRPSFSTTRPAASARSPTQSHASSTPPRKTLDVVTLYVTDRRMIGKIAGGAPRRPRPALLAGEREELGMRGRTAVPPREAARFWRPHPRAPGDAACEGVRPRRRGAAGGHVQPRGLEPAALLRDRRPAPVAAVAAQFDERFSAPAEAVSEEGTPLTGVRERAKATVFGASRHCSDVAFAGEVLGR